jgi:hypothetical protein
MEPDVRQANPAARVRLIDLRVREGRPSVHFGDRLSAILTEPGSRPAAAEAVALTVAGPRPDDADGSVEVNGAVVSVRTLPAQLLPPGAPILVDRAVLGAQWQAWCARRRDELAIAHASWRLERHRIEASLEQARARPAGPPAGEAEGAEPASESEPEPAGVSPDPDEYAEARARVAALLGPADAEEMPPLPEGQLLADAWAAHAALVRACMADDEVPAGELEQLERDVDEARRALADLPQAPPDDVRAHIERSHREVDAAEKNLLEAKRRHRNRAVARYEQAVAIELIALADAGIESYAAYVALVAAAAEADAGGRAEAEAALAAAREALDEARMVRDVPTRRQLAERERLILARATELLGRPPGEDPESELRDLRVEPDRNPETLEAVATLLADAGVDPAGDVVATARAFAAGADLEVPATEPATPVARAAPVAAAPESPTVDEDEIAELEAERRAHDRQLAEIEQEMTRFEALAALDAASLGTDDLTPAIDALFAEYRVGALLHGTLPMVIDGVLDGIGHDARERAIRQFAGADDIQIVVVSDDPEVLQGLAYAGAALVRWPESAPEASARSGA